MIRHKLISKMIGFMLLASILLPGFQVIGMTAELESPTASHEAQVLPVGSHEHTVQVPFEDVEDENVELDSQYEVEGAHALETVVDVASTVHSAYTLAKEPSLKNAGMLAWDIAATLIPGAPGSYVVKGAGALANHSTDVAKATDRGLETRGYHPQSSERTFDGYVNQNVSKHKEVDLNTNSPGFSNNDRNGVGGQFKRIGSNTHGGLAPHVHQPLRNVAKDGRNTGQTFGETGRNTNDNGLTSPGKKDISQLYDHLKNGKYKP